MISQMNSKSQTSPGVFCWLLLGCAPLLVQPALPADDYGDITAVSSLVRYDYVRAKLPNGSFAPETYAFGEGGIMPGPVRDPSIDKLKFLDVARTLAEPLAGQSYLPTRDAKETKLLIMVYWGTTAGAGGASSSTAYQRMSAASQSVSDASAALNAIPHPGGPLTRSSSVVRSSPFGPNVNQAVLMALIEQQAADSEADATMVQVALENDQRDKADLAKARLLGYNRTGMIQTDFGRGIQITALKYRQQDLIDEIEDDRYFVVLLAYDFQQLWKQKKRVLLWETRYSIRQRHNEFDKVLVGMTQYASKYFGQDSQGLIRKPLPQGQVTAGEPKVVEVLPAK
jgi:hypothetical protein